MLTCCEPSLLLHRCLFSASAVILGSSVGQFPSFSFILKAVWFLKYHIQQQFHLITVSKILICFFHLAIILTINEILRFSAAQQYGLKKRLLQFISFAITIIFPGKRNLLTQISYLIFTPC